MFNKAAEVTTIVHDSPNDPGGDHKCNKLNKGMLTNPVHHVFKYSKAQQETKGLKSSKNKKDDSFSYINKCFYDVECQ